MTPKDGECLIFRDYWDEGVFIVRPIEEFNPRYASHLGTAKSLYNIKDQYIKWDHEWEEFVNLGRLDLINILYGMEE